MTNDDLILEIIEKVHENVQKVENKLDGIAAEQVRQNIIVERHEQRSTASEGRLELLEKDAQFVRNLIKILTALSGIALFILKIYPALVSHL